jgi:hypothetical protein
MLLALLHQTANTTTTAEELQRELVPLVEGARRCAVPRKTLRANVNHPAMHSEHAEQHTVRRRGTPRSGRAAGTCAAGARSIKRLPIARIPLQKLDSTREFAAPA